MTDISNILLVSSLLGSVAAVKTMKPWNCQTEPDTASQYLVSNGGLNAWNRKTPKSYLVPGRNTYPRSVL